MRLLYYSGIILFIYWFYKKYRERIITYYIGLKYFPSIKNIYGKIFNKEDIFPDHPDDRVGFLRFCVPNVYFEGYDYVYFTDIDFLFLPQKPGLFDYCIDIMRRSNRRRRRRFPDSKSARGNIMLTPVKPAIKLKDMSLFRQQCYVDGQWVDADDGKTIIGGASLLDTEDRDEAIRFEADDPYAKANIRATVDIVPLRLRWWTGSFDAAGHRPSKANA